MTDQAQTVLERAEAIYTQVYGPDHDPYHFHTNVD